MFFERTGRLFIGRFPGLFRRPEIVHGFSTRKGGISSPPFDTLNCGTNTSDSKKHVHQNRHSFLQTIGIHSESLAIPQQIHHDNIVHVQKPGIFKATDGLITNIPGIILSVQVADCVPVYLYDSVKSTIGLVHAGWRGSAMKIVQKTISQMQEKLHSDPSDIHAFLGPSIGPCCYEVSRDVIDHFPSTCTAGNYLNLWKANTLQLKASGLDPTRIYASGICTKCHNHLFFSHRSSGGKTGRMLAVFGLRN